MLKFSVKTNFNFVNRNDLLAASVKTAFDRLGDSLIKRVRQNMKEDKGAEKRNVKKRVTQTIRKITVKVFGNLIQTSVDEYGRKAGKFPPYHEGSKLYSWVGRKLKPKRKERKLVTFLVAKKIAKKGIPANRPFERAFNDAKNEIDFALNSSIAKYVREVNT